MDLSDILANIADQDKGRECELLDPVTGQATGIKLWIVGPDSKTAHDARIAMADELMELARPDGTIAAEVRECARIHSIARLVQRWEISEGGKSLPFNQKNLLRLLAVSWVEAQIDAFASNRAKFRDDLTVVNDRLGTLYFDQWSEHPGGIKAPADGYERVIG